MEQKTSRACPASDPPHLRVVGSMIRIMRRHHALVERRIGALQIHHSQHRMLMHLARRDGEIPSQKEMAEAMGISPAAVTTTLKRLEKEGYISRSITDEDNRRNEIRITEKGRTKVAESRVIFESVDTAMFEGFTEDEMETLIRFMERIDRNLDAVGAPANPPLSVNNSRTRKEV